MKSTIVPGISRSFGFDGPRWLSTVLEGGPIMDSEALHIQRLFAGWKNGLFDAFISSIVRPYGFSSVRGDVERSVSSGGGNPRDSSTTNVNLSRAFFTLARSGRGLFRARVRSQQPSWTRHSPAPLHAPSLSLSPEKKQAPSNRDHRRRCASKLDDLVKSKTPDASTFSRRSEKTNWTGSKLIFTNWPDSALRVLPPCVFFYHLW